MEIVGGSASDDNKLILYTKHFSAISSIDESGNTLTQSFPHKMNKEHFFSHLLFIRYLIVWFQQEFIEGKTLNINLAYLVPITLYVLDKIFWHLDIVSYLYIIYSIIILFTFNRCKQQIHLHGAEHQVVNYYNRTHEINYDNIADIKRETTYNSACGTFFMLSDPLFMGILSLFIHDFFIKFLLIKMIMPEIIHCENKFVNILFYPLHQLSKWTQLHFTTAIPTYDQVKRGIDCIKELEKCEIGIN